MLIVRKLLEYPPVVAANNCYLFTANSELNQRGRLIMGKGNALAFSIAYPFAPNSFGGAIEHLGVFGCRWMFFDEGMLGAFQTKRNWKGGSKVQLIQKAARELKRMAVENPDWTFHLPFPGINNGGLKVGQVRPILEKLPDNVVVYWPIPKRI